MVVPINPSDPYKDVPNGFFTVYEAITGAYRLQMARRKTPVPETPTGDSTRDINDAAMETDASAFTRLGIPLSPDEILSMIWGFHCIYDIELEQQRVDNIRARNFHPKMFRRTRLAILPAIRSEKRQNSGSLIKTLKSITSSPEIVKKIDLTKDINVDFNITPKALINADASSFEREIPIVHSEQLPDSDLLKVIQFYASRVYESEIDKLSAATNRRRGSRVVAIRRPVFRARKRDAKSRRDNLKFGRPTELRDYLAETRSHEIPEEEAVYFRNCDETALLAVGVVVEELLKAEVREKDAFAMYTEPMQYEEAQAAFAEVIAEVQKEREEVEIVS